MTNKPRSADAFLDLLLRAREVLAACQTDLGARAASVFERARNGDSTDFVEWFEEWRMNHTGNIADEIDAAAPYDDVFAIEIVQAGPLFWIRANEFDDLCYFESLEGAQACAHEHFEGFINELAERRAEEEDE